MPSDRVDRFFEAGEAHLAARIDEMMAGLVGLFEFQFDGFMVV